MTETTSLPRQFVAREPGYAGTLALIAPLASEETAETVGGKAFGGPPYSLRVGGDDSTLAAAREWALRNRYLQAYGIPQCAHGLYMMPSCPADWCRVGAFPGFTAGLDHTQLWVPADASQRPFLLTHPYVREVPAEMQAYARAHGLIIRTDNAKGDGWYHPDALPIRLTIPPGSSTWPIEDRVAVLLYA